MNAHDYGMEIGDTIVLTTKSHPIWRQDTVLCYVGERVVNGELRDFFASFTNVSHLGKAHPLWLDAFGWRFV